MLLNFADITLTQKGNLYLELFSAIKAAVAKGVIKKGEKLPSVREASLQLNVSRTTVENAYAKLCIEGIAESLPQKGYFIIGMPKTHAPSPKKQVYKKEIMYDFSSRSVDPDAADTELWKKLVRSVLWNSGELNSYGDPQGELALRQALADYSYKARGVTASADNIIIGAGVGPLLNILCGLMGREITVGFENGGFLEAKQIFQDYGIDTCDLESDSEGAVFTDLKGLNPDILFLMPSALSKISPTLLSKRRNEFCQWVSAGDKLIIEDDYNGELRYTARSVPAFQRKAPEHTVYIGSFSKLLLPSVRIAYMVLPDFLIQSFKRLSVPYNQTCGKIEQLALEKYIVTNSLEKHLKKLRRLYFSKSQLLIKAIKASLEGVASFKLFESSLKVEIKMKNCFDAEIFLKECEKKGVKISNCRNSYTFSLCFGGIAAEKIENGIICIDNILKNL